MCVSDVLGPHTYLSSPVFLAGNDSRMMKVSDIAHCRRIDFAFAGQSLVMKYNVNDSSTSWVPHIQVYGVGPTHTSIRGGY